MVKASYNVCVCPNKYGTPVENKVYNQSTDSTDGRLSLSVGCGNRPKRGFKTVAFNL